MQVLEPLLGLERLLQPCLMTDGKAFLNMGSRAAIQSIGWMCVTRNAYSATELLKHISTTFHVSGELLTTEDNGLLSTSWTAGEKKENILANMLQCIEGMMRRRQASKLSRFSESPLPL